MRTTVVNVTCDYCGLPIGQDDDRAVFAIGDGSYYGNPKQLPPKAEQIPSQTYDLHTEHVTYWAAKVGGPKRVI